MKDCKVLLSDIRLDESFTFVNDTVFLTDQRRKKHTCYVCLEKFTTAKQLAKHRALHTDSEAEDDIFEEDVGLKSNKQLSSRDKDFKEPASSIKSKMNYTRKDLTENNQNSSTPAVSKEGTSSKKNDDQAETPFKCDTCQVFFESSDTAKLHKVTTRCKFSCKLCKRKFNTLYAFVVHVMQHRVNTAKNPISTWESYTAYSCSLCEKSFADCFQLKRHEILTHNMKPSNATSASHTSSLNEPQPTVADSPSQQGRVTDDITTNLETPALPEITEENEVAGHDEHQATQNEQESNVTASPTEISCELCYDVFNCAEDLNIHMEFHKQLSEKKSDAILIEDDEDDIVEVIEKKKDANEIVTTIKKSSVSKTTQSDPTVSKYATLTPIYTSPQVSTVKMVSPATTTKSVSNQMLSAKIKEMLIPSSEKTSKTILLDPKEKMPQLIPVHKLQKKKAVPQKQQFLTLPTNANFELRKTGPQSYSFCHKDNTFILPAVTTATVDNSPTLISSAPAVSSTGEIDLAQQSLSSSIVTTCSSSSSSSTPNIAFILTNVPTPDPTLPSQSGTSKLINTSLALQNNTSISTTAVLPTVTNCDPNVPSTSLGTNSSKFNDSVQVQNSPNLSGIFSSIQTNSSLPNTNITYIINPTPSQSISQFSDPSTRIAYVIIPHGNTNTSTVTSQSPVSSNRIESTSVQLAGPTTDSKLQRLLSKPIKERSSRDTPSEDGLKQSSPMPLITKVTSLLDQPGSSSALKEKSKDDKNATSKVSDDPLSIEVAGSLVPGDLISQSGSNISNDIPIVIDSDSSQDEDNLRCKETLARSDNDSDSADGDLVIDENATETSKEPAASSTQERKGLIFVRKLDELLEKKSDTMESKTQEEDDKKDEKKKKEKKWNFPMKCDGCSVVFQRMRGMRHHDKRRHKCVYCDFKCCKIANLKEHYLKEHKTYFCRSCSFLASSNYSFKEHRRQQHTCSKCNGSYAKLATHVCAEKELSEKGEETNKETNSETCDTQP